MSVRLTKDQFKVLNDALDGHYSLLAGRMHDAGFEQRKEGVTPDQQKGWAEEEIRNQYEIDRLFEVMCEIASRVEVRG